MPTTEQGRVALTQAQKDELADLDRARALIQGVRAAAQRDRSYGFDQPWAVFVRRMSLLTPQSYGTRFQDRLAAHFGWTVVPSKLDRGDIVDAHGAYHEVKTTLITGSNPMANFVQIRPHQDIAGYHLFVVDRDLELVHLWLSKADMQVELGRVGQSAHGTKAAVSANTTREFAIRFPWTPDDPTSEAARWVARYRQQAPLPA